MRSGNEGMRSGNEGMRSDNKAIRSLECTSTSLAVGDGERIMQTLYKTILLNHGTNNGHPNQTVHIHVDKTKPHKPNPLLLLHSCSSYHALPKRHKMPINWVKLNGISPYK